MIKKIMLTVMLGGSSLFAMEKGTGTVENYSDQYKIAYQQAYQFGVAALAKYEAAGMQNMRAAVIPMLMKREQQKNLAPELSKPRIAAFVDLLQGKQDKFAGNQ